MGRNTEEIYNSIIEVKDTMDELDGLTPEADDAQTLLTDLSSETNVADWRIWTWIYSYGQSIHEKFWDTAKAEIVLIANSGHYGSLPWWRFACFDFQLGHDIEFIDDRWKYATVDSDAQIIKRAASSELPITQEVVLKVAKDGGIPLSPVELDAFTAYAEEIAPAGINTTIISQDPDDLYGDFEVFYDPLVLAADGSLLSDPSIFPVEDAINNHIDNIDFDGEIVKTYLQDDMQKASGVINPVIRFIYSRIGVAPYEEIGDKKQAFSGHFRIDPVILLSTQITYTPNV